MASHYLKILSITFSFFVILVGIFNFIVNPFDLFSSPRIKHFNSEKTEFHKYLLLSKAHAVRFYQPSGIILGTSRAEYGLDPEHPAWSPDSQPIYNLGLSNGRIQEAFEFLKHAHVHGHLKQVVLGADFFMFANQFKVNTIFDHTRLSNEDKLLIETGWYRDIFNSLFTLDALFASINTIKNQEKEKTILYFSNGMKNPKGAWQKIQAQGGHHAVFLSNIKHSLTDKTSLAAYSLIDSKNRKSPTLDILSELIRFCLERNIELKIIISPIHAYKLETFYHLGLWELYEYWKIRMNSIVESENLRNPDSIATELWDFTGYNIITTESVPSINQPNKRMRWYWEGSHYRREVGDKVLNCVLDKSLSNKCSFGKKLNSTNISEHLLKIRNDGIKYRATHKSDIITIKTLIKDTEAERNRIREQMGWIEPKL